MLGIFLLLLNLSFCADSPRWSVVVYSGGDELEMGPHSDRAIEEILNLHLTKDVEFIIEHDDYKSDHVTRYIKTINHTRKEMGPEVDSSDPKHFEEFVSWAFGHARGENILFIVMGHAWGWKGIIQDFHIPDQPGASKIMPLREFGQVLSNAKRRPDVLFLDACVLANVESLEELKTSSRYIVASQREIPFAGFPLQELIPLLDSPKSTPRELARALPEIYVRSYARGGAMVEQEGEYDVVTLASFDMKNWQDFISKFAFFVEALKASSFQNNLRENPKWLNSFGDDDWNVDLVEFLFRVQSFTDDPRVKLQADRLITEIGYPEEIAQLNSCAIHLNATPNFEVQIESDELLENDKALEKLTKRFRVLNLDLAVLHVSQGSQDLQFFLSQSGGLKSRRFFHVRGQAPTPLILRPWLPGTKRVRTAWVQENGLWKQAFRRRAFDYSVVRKFPSRSFMLSEAHTQGAPFERGVGILFKPLMDQTEIMGTDPLSGLQGPDFYRSLRFNQLTKWADVMLLKN